LADEHRLQRRASSRDGGVGDRGISGLSRTAPLPRDSIAPRNPSDRRKTINTFDAFRKKRNITGYERIGLVSDADAAAMRALAVKLRDDLILWIEKHRPELLEGR
jgi:hypothetical protein